MSNSKKGLENSGLNGDLNPNLCDGGAVLYQLNHQANWELVMWFDYKPVEVEVL